MGGENGNPWLFNTFLGVDEMVDWSKAVVEPNLESKKMYIIPSIYTRYSKDIARHIL